MEENLNRIILRLVHVYVKEIVTSYPMIFLAVIGIFDPKYLFILCTNLDNDTHTCRVATGNFHYWH